MKFDENLAAIHAYLCSDGYVIKNPPTQKNKYYYIGFRNTNLKLLKDFQTKFKKYFKITPRLNVGERCVVQKKELYEKLIKKFGSFYSREWQIPKLNKKLACIWLRSFFDCEGWVICKTHQNRHIGLDSVNKKGIEGIKKLLKNLGIDSKLKKRTDRDIFSLKIYGKDNLLMFHKKINFLHEDKKKLLNKVVNDFVDYYWKFPKNTEKIKKEIKKIMKNKAKINSHNKIIRIISNKEDNLISLKKGLNNLFNIECRIGKRINGIGTIYFEMDINKKEEIKKIILNKLISSEEKKKWLKLTK